MILHNKYDKATLRKKLEEEGFTRTTLSFYRYIAIHDPQAYRDDLYKRLDAIKVLGRVYVAEEGINAQISVPDNQFDLFEKILADDPIIQNVPLKIAVEDNGKSFIKLIVRVREKIVADGLHADTFDVTNVGKHLSAEEFNEAMEQPDTIVLDMRNHYESEVGKFEGALCPDADTFREALTKGLELVKDRTDQKILLYCTGGIRCEKASAWFKHHGFNDVNQLYGGIIEYARHVRNKGLQPKFIGKNFVFDDRMGERISEDIISQCHQCGAPSDNHVNCANDDCHLLFIQCDECATKYEGCCTPKCQQIIHLPIEEQRAMRKGKQKIDSHSVYKSRIRPKLNEELKYGKGIATSDDK
jgi:UPF0176 protein